MDHLCLHVRLMRGVSRTSGSVFAVCGSEGTVVCSVYWGKALLRRVRVRCWDGRVRGGWKGRCFGVGTSVTSGGVPPFYERGAVRVVVVFKDLGECADGAISLD